jgi:hypothetical protein
MARDRINLGRDTGVRPAASTGRTELVIIT